MPRRRSHAADLVKLLESAAQPLYVLDDALEIVYLNEACRNWLGPDAEQLPGRKCVYHAGGGLSGPDAVAAEICPPPTVLEGREVSADVALRSAEQTLFRRVRFLPLCRPGEEVLCIVALVDLQDHTEELTESGTCGGDEAQELHEHLQRFRQQTALRYRWELVAGVVPAMRRVRAQAEMAAVVRASVLLLGPPGSGRRHLAEAIHFNGPADSIGPLVPLECSLLDVESIQSTLHGAVERKERGTLLLCDADQLSAESQAALATVLGSGRCPLRVISTSAAPLVELWPRGLFREDLAAVLSTITIELPPLAKRRDDLPLLAQVLLEEQNVRGGKQLAGFSSEALDRLCATVGRAMWRNWRR